MKLAEAQRKEFYEKALYPCVRVRTNKAGGSGQVIWSNERDGTFVLTCEHVVDDAITIKEEWSSVLQRMVKKDVLSEVYVDFFKYDLKDRAVGAEEIKAEIIAYDKNEDLALLRLLDPTPRKYVAKVAPDDYEVKYFEEVVTIGAALGHEPIATVGNICGFKDVIDNRDYMLSTAPSIFGSSGGATFTTRDWTLIGMPARISVILTGFAADPITHMGYIIPYWRINKFFRDQMMDFLLDPSVSYEECLKRREEARKKSELELLLKEGKK